MKKEGGDVWRDGVCLPKKPYCMMSPGILEVAEHHSLAYVNFISEQISSFALLLFYIVKRVFISIHEFSNFYLSDSLCHPSWGE